MRICYAAGVIAFFALMPPAIAQNCANPGGVRYHPGAPAIFAPDATRALGFLIEVDTPTPRRPPDLRPQCLPLPIRYNNPGALKTPQAGPWPGQVGKDTRGHAVFTHLEDGVAAWLTWLKRRIDNGTNTPFKLMSMYAPPDDCIGSVDKLPNGQCPPGFPLNDTAGYARRVANVFGIGIHDKIALTPPSCKNRQGMKAFFGEVMQVELGARFCHRKCGMQGDMFDKAADRVWGPVPHCS
jgi:hypothetical protein